MSPINNLVFDSDTPASNSWFQTRLVLLSPAQDSAQQRGVETLRRREASLHLADRHLVLGGWAEQWQAARHRTEDLRWVGHHAHAQALLAHGQRWEGRAVEFGRDGDCRKEREQRWDSGGVDGGKDNKYTRESRPKHMSCVNDKSAPLLWGFNLFSVTLLPCLFTLLFRVQVVPLFGCALTSSFGVSHPRHLCSHPFLRIGRTFRDFSAEFWMLWMEVNWRQSFLSLSFEFVRNSN